MLAPTRQALAGPIVVPEIAPLANGSIVDGRYRVLALLGEGMSGRVYRARQLTLDRDVALKTLHPEHCADPEFIDRFRNEARLASSIDGPHLASVYDFGNHDGGLYIVMQLIEGRLLDQVQAEGPLDPRRACELIRQLTEAMAAIHDAGIVHADLKPGNIVLTGAPDGETLVLLDFGIARRAEPLVSTGARKTTREERVAGTPGYMAPEVLGGVPPTPAADIYAAGVILFELLTGAPPFAGDGLQLLQRHAGDPVPEPSWLRPELSPIFDDICGRAMAKNPADRFADARELGSALRDALSSLSGPLLLPSADIAPPPLVGRRTEIERLAGIIDRTDRSPVLRLVGVAGSGRTSAVDEARRRAAAESSDVVVAGADRSGQPTPYAPIREAIARLVGRSHLDPAAEIADAVLDRVVLGGALDGLVELLRADATAIPCAPADRRELCLRAALAVIEKLADRRTTLIFDDADQYDELSREIVAALAGRLPAGGGRLIVVTTPDDALLCQVEQLELAPLDEAAISEIATSIGGLVEPPSIGTLQRLGGTSPAHLVQLARFLAEDPRRTAPDTFADVILPRLASLSDGARRLAEVVGACGRSATLTWLAEQSDTLALDDLRASSEEAIEAGFLIDRGGELEIPCQRVRELVRATTPPVRRRAFHRLAAGREDAPALARGYHALEAGDLEDAARWLCDAGDQLLRFGAASGAASAYRDAHTAARAAYDQAPDPLGARAVQRAAVGLAHAYCDLDRPDAAASALESVRAGADPDDPRRWSVHLVQAWARVAFARGDAGDAIEALREQLPDLRRPITASAYARLARQLAEMLAQVSGPRVAAAALAAECEQVTGRAGMLPACCELLVSTSDFLLAAGETELAVRQAERACAAAAGLADSGLRWSCHRSLALALDRLGDTEAAACQRARASQYALRAAGIDAG